MDIILHMIGLAFIPLIMMVIYAGCRNIFDVLKEVHGQNSQWQNSQFRSPEATRFPSHILQA